MRCHFDSRAGDELVDDHLRAVGEVAELRLPDHELARIARALKPYSNPSTAFSESMLLMMTNGAWPAPDVRERDVACAGPRRRAARRGGG